MIKYDNKDWRSYTFALHGTVLPRIWPWVFYLGAFSVILWGIQYFTGFRVQTDPLAHSLIGIALGLLLVFRNNSCYERWWEGRRCWGGIVNASRNLMRGAVNYAGIGAPMARLVAAYPFALKQHLRQNSADLDDLANFLPPEEVAGLAGAANPPMLIADRMSRLLAAAIAEGRLRPEQAIPLEGTICELLNLQGACERIVKTPLPFVHAAHIRQLLLLYLITLPFILLPKMEGLAIPAVMIIVFGLIGIEEAGVEIEDPFGDDPNDLPTEALSHTIALDAAAMAGTSFTMPPIRDGADDDAEEVADPPPPTGVADRTGPSAG